ncbi:hypothetical protein T492DRAFT_970891 [Pavlovales sp. CCMP2436]|nr:hypothetical protein T492DRAFT_970891 [Pavlovales sp. CCMP2436]
MNCILPRLMRLSYSLTPLSTTPPHLFMCLFIYVFKSYSSSSLRVVERRCTHTLDPPSIYIAIFLFIYI